MVAMGKGSELINETVSPAGAGSGQEFSDLLQLSITVLRVDASAHLGPEC
jgi:hypothetical protein